MSGSAGDHPPDRERSFFREQSRLRRARLVDVAHNTLGSWDHSPECSGMRAAAARIGHSPAGAPRASSMLLKGHTLPAGR